MASAAPAPASPASSTTASGEPERGYTLPLVVLTSLFFMWGFITCLNDGLLEMCKDLGETVIPGELLARVHDTARTGMTPIEYRARRGGLLASRHFPGLIGCGDTLAVVADIVSPSPRVQPVP